METSCIEWVFAQVMPPTEFANHVPSRAAPGRRFTVTVKSRHLNLTSAPRDRGGQLTAARLFVGAGIVAIVSELPAIFAMFPFPARPLHISPAVAARFRVCLLRLRRGNMRWTEFSRQRADVRRQTNSRADEAMVVDARSVRRPSEFVDQKLSSLLRDHASEAVARPAVRP
jgi:hypothetical protein